MILLDEHPVIVRQLKSHGHSVAYACLGRFPGLREGLLVPLEISAQVVLARKLVVIAEVRHSLIRAQLLPITVQRLPQPVARLAPPQVPAGVLGLDYLEEQRRRMTI